MTHMVRTTVSTSWTATRSAGVSGAFLSPGAPVVRLWMRHLIESLMLGPAMISGHEERLGSELRS